MVRAFLLFPVMVCAMAVLNSCDLPGLDFRSPSDAREYTKAGARGDEAIYFKALDRVLSTTAGPVTILVPNMGDREIKAHIEADLRQQNLNPSTFLNSEAVARLARANIFPLAHLTTGTHRSLDGKSHVINCDFTDPNGNIFCQIDGLIEARNLRPPGKNGSVYSTLNVKEVNGRGYLPF